MKGILVCSRSRAYTSITILALLLGSCSGVDTVQRDGRAEGVADNTKRENVRTPILAALRGAKVKKGAIKNYRFFVPFPMAYVSNNYNYGGEDPRPISVATARYEFPKVKRWPPTARVALIELDLGAMNSGSDEKKF